MRPSGFLKASKAQYLVSAAAAVMLSACSSSMERFADNPSDGDPVYTSSVPKDGAASDTKIASRPLARAPVGSAANSAKTGGYEYPSSGSGPAPQTASAAGGSVKVEPGITLYSIAKANGMTVQQLANANGIPAPYAVHPGQVLQIPGRSAAVTPPKSFEPRATMTRTEPAYAAPDRKPVAAEAHAVRSGETLFSLGRSYGVSPYAIADLNGLPHTTTLHVGQTVRIPGGGHSAVPAALAQTEKPVEGNAAKPKDLARAEPIKPGLPAQAQAQQIPDGKPAPAAKQIATNDVGEPASEPALPAMRWPVKGKVISDYGAKPNGLRNEGINIAVPEGTSVRAAESGIVAYAGNELKGYGNLVLIRHDSGWVTAYAHNKELFVKRGDAVKRGDVIAKAGQTGSVSSPQLHFEVRKGATAMDPMKFLGSSTAMN